MLYHPLKPKRLLLGAAVAKERFLLVFLSKRPNLEIEDPLHILDSQLLCPRTLRRIDDRFSPSGSCIRSVLFDVRIEPLPHVEQHFDSEAGAGLLRNLVTIIPLLRNDLIRIAYKPCPKWTLGLIP
jgi:hypothetical protein